MLPEHYHITPVNAPEVENTVVRKYGEVAQVFCYAIKFNTSNMHMDYQAGVATVVAQDSLEALRLFRAGIFMYSIMLDSINKDISAKNLTVLCQAHVSQIGKFIILTDGEY